MSVSFDEAVETIQNIDLSQKEHDELGRRRCLAEARALVQKLQTPIESMWDVTFAFPALYSSLQLANDLDIFDKLDEDDGEPKSTEQLSGDADAGLVRRALRHLAAMNMVDERAPDLWAPTRHTTALRRPELFAASEWAATTWKAYSALPLYLRSINYQNPGVGSFVTNNWQFATGSKNEMYDWLAENRAERQVFSKLMKVAPPRRGPWLNVYPSEKVLEGADDCGPLIVDIGAGHPIDMKMLLEEQPSTAGRIIFQDRENVIEDARRTCPNGLLPMAHCMSRPQPVRGARFYFLHNVILNWPEDRARKILKNVKMAMRKGYSRMLLYEMIMPDEGANPIETSLDLAMAALFGARQRSESEWKEFLGSVGLRIIKFWRNPTILQGVIEAEVE